MARKRFFLRWVLSCVCAGAAFSFTGCLNVFSPLESPSGDLQLLSKARACFDDGDLACALKYYQMLSPAYGDIQQSEQAFLTLDQNGAGMKVFITAFGSGQGGPGATAFASSMSSSGASSTIRGNIESAFLMSNNIGSANLAALVQFVSAAAMLGEVLGETAGSTGSLLQSQIAANPTACAADTSITCLADANCDSGTGGLANGTGTITTLTTQTVASIQSAGLTLDLLYAAASDATTALATLGATGKFQADLQTFTTAITAVGGLGGLGGTPNRCLRNVLLTSKVGN